MGIDTVTLRSPNIDEGTAQFLENQCLLRQGIDLASGEILYELTSGELDGSFDSRISFRVKRNEHVSLNGRVELVDCDPYLIVECSWHKFFYGQNIYGGPRDFQVRAALFIDLLGDLLSADQDMLPSAARWQVRRVDWAEVYSLTPAMIAEFFRGISHCKFPRRSSKAAKFGVNAVYFPGAFTTVKLYHKGPEFKEHDRTRLRFNLKVLRLKQRRGMNDPKIDAWVERKLKALQRLADNRLRVEVELHGDKLCYDFGGKYPTVSEITDEYLMKVHDAEIFKLLREGKTEMETVRTHDAVKGRLNSVYGKRAANALWAFWLQLATRGEDVIRDEVSRTAFYRNRKQLVEAGVSWLGSDVIIVANDTALPRDFKPMRTDLRLCSSPVRNESVFNHCPVEWAQLKAAA